MGRRTGLGNPKNFAERREKKIDNLLADTRCKRNPVAFRELYQKVYDLQQESFKAFESSMFVKFKANLNYIQLCSGLNQLEFCCIAGITSHALSEDNQYPNTIPIHSFTKSYSIMHYYLPSIEFCDMFNILFSETFPRLKDDYTANRLKLGKTDRKQYTFKNGTKKAKALV
tara:strand:+ start:125 stop:637 length:513 start_codon:yes stop_codon:yes gene_type:complete